MTDLVGSEPKPLAGRARLWRARLASWGKAARPRFGADYAILVLALVAAVLSGLAVVAFRMAIERINALLYGSSPAAHSPWLILIPGLAGLAIALLIARLFPTMGGSGVNQTKTAVYIEGGRMPLRAAIGKAVTASLAVGAGYSLGPEDPSLHIGAAIASFVGRIARLSRENLRLMAPIGAAAGLAAAFNAPLSAVFFVLEEITGGWTARTLGAAILAASASVVIARSLLGAGPLFHIPVSVVVEPATLIGWVGIGIAGGFASVFFAGGLGLLRSRLRALPRWTRYLQPALAGLAIGTIGYLGAPQVMGAGYDVVNRAIASPTAWQFLAILAALKILATTLSVASGTPGGLFAPTLVIGALIGGAVGGAEHAVWQGVPPLLGTDALIGMSALFAGFLRVPMTAVVMVVEVSNNYSIAVPAMIAAVIAYAISRRFRPVPIFDQLSRQDGVWLPSMEHERETVALRIEDALLPPPRPVLAGHQTVAEAVKTMAAAGEAHMLVHGGTAGWRLLNRTALQMLVDQGRGDACLRSIFPAEKPPCFHPDRPLASALPDLHAWPLVPVLHRADAAHLLGILTLDAALSAYRVKP